VLEVAGREYRGGIDRRAARAARRRAEHGREIGLEYHRAAAAIGEPQLDRAVGEEHLRDAAGCVELHRVLVREVRPMSL
jgi:hypothetical protein